MEKADANSGAGQTPPIRDRIPYTARPGYKVNRCGLYPTKMLDVCEIDGFPRVLQMTCASEIRKPGGTSVAHLWHISNPVRGFYE
jgi:hypothetical protein